MTFDDTHRFASEEDPSLNNFGAILMSDKFLATPEQSEGRKDIDQALSLLQLSGSSTQVRMLVGGTG